MSLSNNGMSSTTWHVPDRHPKLRTIKHLEGDWQQLPELLMRKLCDHLDNGGDDDFAGIRWPDYELKRLDQSSTGETARYQLKGAADDQKLKAARFSYQGKSGGHVRQLQIIVVSVTGGNDLKTVGPVIVKHQHGPGRILRDDLREVWTQKARIWKPIHERASTESAQEPEILRVWDRAPVVSQAGTSATVTGGSGTSAGTAKMQTPERCYKHEPPENLQKRVPPSPSKGDVKQQSPNQQYYTSTPTLEYERSEFGFQDNRDVSAARKYSRSTSHVSISSDSDIDAKIELPKENIAKRRRKSVQSGANPHTRIRNQAAQHSAEPGGAHNPQQSPQLEESVLNKFDDRSQNAEAISSTTTLQEESTTPPAVTSYTRGRSYENVMVTFKDADDQIRNEYGLPFTECSSARALFDTARVARVADKQIRTLEVQITGKQTEYVRKDSQVDFQRNILDKLNFAVDVGGELEKILITVKKDM